MRDRVKPPRLAEDDVLERLKEDGVFETKQKGMMFAAAVGFVFHRSEIADTQFDLFGEPIRLSVFAEDDGLIDALAVATSGDLAIMSPERQEERVDLFERFALQGLKDLKKACYDERPEYPLNGILNLMDQMKRADSEDLPGLEGIF
jgi:dnd system-associated protein 4